MADIAITGGTKGDIFVKGETIDIQDALLLAPDRISFSVAPSGTPSELGKGTRECR
jgi:hypothetical protein